MNDKQTRTIFLSYESLNPLLDAMLALRSSSSYELWELKYHLAVDELIVQLNDLLSVKDE